MSITTQPTQPSAPVRDDHVTIRVSRPDTDTCFSTHPERISDLLEEPGVLIWVNVRNPGEGEVAMLRQEFGFHRLALEDVLNQQQRPKVDEYPGYYFVVMHAILPPEHETDIRTAELDLFVGERYVVTAHREPIPALEEAANRWERTEPQLREHVGFLVHTIVDAVVDAYFPVVDHVEDRLDSLELSLYDGKGQTSPEDLLCIKRNLFTLRKAIYPVREVFNVFLSRDQSMFAQETRPYFQDVYDHVLRLLDIIEIQRDMATGTLDAHLAVVSNRLNETMKKLTVLGICVAIMGATFGAWGMNFDRVPLSHHPAGFWILSAVVLIIISVFLTWAKKRDLW